MKKYIIIATISVTLVTTLFVIKCPLEKDTIDTKASRASIDNNITVEPPKPLSPQNSIAETLKIAHAIRQENPVNKEALREMEQSVHKTKANYEKVISVYQNAITSYEQLSQNFDLQLRQGASSQDLAQLDKQLQAQAQKILALKKESNNAYVDLMNQLDEVLPGILEKNFRSLQ